MLNKKIMVLAILIVGLLAVSAVSAAENATDDVIELDDESGGNVINVNENDEFVEVDSDENAEISSSVADEDILGSSPPSSAYSVSVYDVSVNYGYSSSIKMTISPASYGYSYKYDFYLKVYDSGNSQKISKRYSGTTSAYSKTYSLDSYSLSPGVYTIKIINYYDNNVMDTAKLTVNKINIQYVGISGNCTSEIQYKVRVSNNDKYLAGQRVIFTCNGKEYSVYTDNQGYATLNVHLQAGTYSITAKYSDVSYKKTIKIDPVLVENDYKNVYVKSLTCHYGDDKKVSYGWQGNLEGYFRVYKGNKILYETKLNSNGYVEDYMEYVNHDGFYSASKLKSIGTYKAVICDNNGKQLASAQIKVMKASTIAVSVLFKSKIGARDYIYAGISDKNGNLIKTSGKAQFKIFGKTYNVKLNKGVAYVILKFPLKAKKYQGSFKFFGNSNYKASYVKFKVILGKKDVVILKKDRTIKIGKYSIKLTKNQYNKLVKSFNSGKSKSLDIKTGYNYKFKVKYTKTIKKYKTTKTCKTLYGTDYMPTMEKMWSYGWEKVSEYTYTKKNPRNKEGIGLSAYTYAVTKWVKTTYKTAYKTKTYPVKAYIRYDKKYIMPDIEVYAHYKTLKYKLLAIE